MGTQYHLTRYAFLYETTTAADGELLSPSDSPGGEKRELSSRRSSLKRRQFSSGLKATFESIDNRNDFKKYMQNFAVARGSMRTIRRDTPQEDGFVGTKAFALNAPGADSVRSRSLQPSLLTSKLRSCPCKARQRLRQKRRSCPTVTLAASHLTKSHPLHHPLPTLYRDPRPSRRRARPRHLEWSSVNKWFVTEPRCPKLSKSARKQ